MSGGKAPSLWREGQHRAVLDYLADDVRSTLELAQEIEKHGRIDWMSNNGYPQSIPIPKLHTVKECLKIKRKIPKWVTEPVKLKSMMEWINDAKEKMYS